MGGFFVLTNRLNYKLAKYLFLQYIVCCIMLKTSRHEKERKIRLFTI
ncbi:MAG: hypothetical protein KatS3mg033_1085 [Thermonema sp.]|nr:MAG: hypothetical protein KatS3mg033_1085 [Thermonema sp.]